MHSTPAAECCTPEFLESKGNFLQLQLTLQSVPLPRKHKLWIKDNTCFHYFPDDISIYLTSSYGYWMIFSHSPKVGQHFLIKPIENITLHREQTLQPPLITKLSPFKAFHLIYLIKIAFNFIIYHPRKRNKSILKSKQVTFTMLLPSRFSSREIL